jgi:hypothetical protein
MWCKNLFFISASCYLLCNVWLSPAAEQRGEIILNYDKLFSCNDYPLITCTDAELIRLRQAMVHETDEGKVVLKKIQEAQKKLPENAEYPPRGGRHNQWYQCDKCQVALVTVDKHHHKCPICNKIYSGEPYDDVLFNSIHNANFARMLNSAWSYALTAKETFAADAVSILTNYAALFLSYPKRGNTKWNLPYTMLTGARLSDQTLDEAYLFATKIAPAFDLVYNSSSFTEENKLLVKEKLLAPMLENIKKNWANPGNWQSWHNAALFMGGILLKRQDFVEHSLYHPSNGFFAQMEKCVTGDGMWFENSWGYHFYALQALSLQAEAARRIGIDLWKNEQLKKMFLMPLLMIMPDGTLPRFGDDVATSPFSSGDLYEAAFNYYKDERMKMVLPKKTSFNSVMFGRKTRTASDQEATKLPSIAFTNSGYVLLRTYGTKELALAATFSPFGGYHSHFDKMSFVFFGFNKELGVDCGRAVSQAYRLPIHKNWYRATISHNTVVVDGISQNAAAGKMEFFYATNNLAIAVLTCNKHYKDVEQKRLFVLSDKYLLVADKLESAKERCFDWLYHNRGTNVLMETPLTGTFTKPSDTGWEYINSITSGIASGKVQADFQNANCVVKVIIPGGGNVLSGNGPGSSIKDRIPLLAVRRYGKGTFFVALFEPTTNNVFFIKNINWQRIGEETAITVMGDNFKDEFKWIDNMNVSFKTDF